MPVTQVIKQIKIADVRQSISNFCYSRSLFKTFFWLSVDVSLFIGSIILIFVLQNILLKVMAGIFAGAATAMLFLWAHDAAHGTLFKSKILAEWLGTIAMLPSLNVYRLWCYGHNRSHHGFTSLTPVDWVWRPLSREEYSNLNLFQRWLYRIERSLTGCGLHYFRRVWWEVMMRYNPGKDNVKKRYYRHAKWVVFVYIVVIGLSSYCFAGGIVGILCALVIPFIIFNYCIAFITYLHHTHPKIPFFDHKDEWSNTIGYLYCCTIVKMNRVFAALTHNIFIHVPHHVDMRIPFYRLKSAGADIAKSYGAYIHQYDFSWQAVNRIFKHCKLYNYKEKSWSRF